MRKIDLSSQSDCLQLRVCVCVCLLKLYMCTPRSGRYSANFHWQNLLLVYAM